MISMHRDELNQEFASSLTRVGIAAVGWEENVTPTCADVCGLVDDGAK